MTKNLIPGAVLNQLWSLYSANQSDLLADHRRGAIIIIGMLTKNSRHIIVERLGTLVKTGFGTAGKVLLHIFTVHHILIMMQRAILLWQSILALHCRNWEVIRKLKEGDEK
jgi:hypothetical protein